MLKYVRKVIKHQDTQTIHTTVAPLNVLDKSIADVSLLAGMLVDKFVYHLPFYRQHQRIQKSGITLSRAIDLLVLIDTNHLEQALRPIPMGRRNWLFCWTVIGAKQVAIIQSLLVTCKLQEVGPYAYLEDVLQRISQHPASKAVELTPRVWKNKFSDNPLRSDLDTSVYNGLD